MTSATVFSKPGCYQCRETLRALDKHNVDYEVVDVSVDSDARHKVETMGFLALPVVSPESGEPWSGLRPDLIRSTFVGRAQ